MSTENKKPDNPTAFPVTELNQDGTPYFFNQGMSLRDYFAAKAMSSLSGPIFYQGNDETEKSLQSFAKRSYMIADAMLKERENVQ